MERAVLLMCLSANLCAQEPIVKSGGCPLGYYADGAYCIPARKHNIGARITVEKVKKCPPGYYEDRSYCVKMQKELTRKR